MIRYCLKMHMTANRAIKHASMKEDQYNKLRDKMEKMGLWP